MSIALLCATALVGWVTLFGHAPSGSSVLHGETADGSGLRVELDREHRLRAVETRLSAECDDETTFDLAWAPDEPHRTALTDDAATTLRETAAVASPAGTPAALTVVTIAQPSHGRSIHGTVQANATYATRDGTRVTCRAAPVRWSATKRGRGPDRTDR